MFDHESKEIRIDFKSQSSALSVHHKYTETDADPHNAARGFFFSHMGWLMLKKHPEVVAKGNAIDMSDIRADPIVMFQKR